MFISERLVFLELHKTGCTHIRNILKQEIAGELVGKHNQAPRELFTRDRKFLGSVRDPWDWYVSLWAYGCDQKGAIFSQATSEKEREKIAQRRNFSQRFKAIFTRELDRPSIWRDLYKDPTDYKAFRNWLTLIHNFDNREILAEGYEYSKLGKFAGFLSYRYLKLFCCRQGANQQIQAISSAEEMLAFEKSNCFIDYFVRNEHLETDLFSALEQLGYRISDQKRQELENSPKTNVSSRIGGLKDYYDSYSLSIVEDREQLLIKKFNYQSPAISTDCTQESKA